MHGERAFIHLLCVRDAFALLVHKPKPLYMNSAHTVVTQKRQSMFSFMLRLICIFNKMFRVEVCVSVCVYVFRFESGGVYLRILYYISMLLLLMIA